MPEFIERSETAEFFEKSEQIMWHKDDIAATISSKSNVPAADVAEIVHSKWIKRNNERRCPVCGFFYLTNGMTVYNLCPMCGAKMDRKE